MAGGGFGAASGGGDFEAKITPLVIMSCIMAASGGLMFGYDVGISGRHCGAFHIIHVKLINHFFFGVKKLIRILS